jgi:hypothetical protein
MSNVASNPDYKTITYKKYSYILPKVKNMFSRAREYIKDRINVIKTKTMTMTMTKTKKQDDVHFNYVAFKEGKGKQIRKRKSRIQTRKIKSRIQTRKIKSRIQTRKKNTRQKKNKK